MASVCPVAAVVIGFISFIAYFALCLYADYRAHCIYADGRPHDGERYAVIIFGPFCPLVEGLGKIYIREGQVAHQKNQYLEPSFSEAVQFFQADLSGLHQALQNKIVHSRHSLETVQNLPIKTPSGEKELQNRLKSYEEAFEELRGADAFYSKV